MMNREHNKNRQQGQDLSQAFTQNEAMIQSQPKQQEQPWEMISGGVSDQQLESRLVSYQISCADFVFLATILSGIIGSFLLSYLKVSQYSYQLGILCSELVLFLPTAVFLLWECRRKIGSVRGLGYRLGFRRIHFMTLLLSILFGFLVRPFALLLNEISMLFVKNETGTAISSSVESGFLPVSLLMIAVIPAFMEEVIYRGFFYQHYRLLGWKRGAFCAGLIFGLMHLNFNQFAYAFCMGILLCVLFEATGSVWPGIITHIIVNGTSVITSFLASQASSENVTNQLQENTEVLSRDVILSYIKASAVPAVLFLIIALLLLRYMLRYEKRTWKQEGDSVQKYPGVIYVVAAMLCLVIMGILEWG